MSADEIITRSGGTNALKGRTIRLNTFAKKKLEQTPPPFDLKEVVDTCDKLRGTLIRYSQAEEQRIKELELRNLRELSFELWDRLKLKEKL